MRAWLRRWRAHGTREVDAASLAAFRIIFGLLMLVSCLRLLASDWLEVMYLQPKWFFHYPGFEWVAPWPGKGMYVHYAVLAVLALAITLGVAFRWAMGLFVLGFAYTQLLDVTNYLNHHYLVVLLGVLLWGLPCDGMYVLGRARRRCTRVPAWTVWLLRFQVGVVYFFAGLAKAKSDWLFAGQPLATWLAARDEMPVLGPLFVHHGFALAMSWAGFVFDTTVWAWLSWRRTRPYAYAVVLGFHGFTGYLFNIGMFPFIMSSCALIFFSPSWPRHLGAWWRARVWGGAAKSAAGAASVPATPTAVASTGWTVRRPRLVAIMVGAHVAVQLLLPLRHFAYPGAVLWNEDGMRFAWHVMVREKHGKVMYLVEVEGGGVLQVPPANYLNARQERELAGQPDLILQLARHVAKDLCAHGYQVSAVRARTLVSLNGRPAVPLIEPDVDLLAIRDLGPRWWVTRSPR